jgi:hypothetical protein
MFLGPNKQALLHVLTRMFSHISPPQGLAWGPNQNMKEPKMTAIILYVLTHPLALAWFIRVLVWYQICTCCVCFRVSSFVWPSILSLFFSYFLCQVFFLSFFIFYFIFPFFLFLFYFSFLFYFLFYFSFLFYFFILFFLSYLFIIL